MNATVFFISHLTSSDTSISFAMIALKCFALALIVLVATVFAEEGQTVKILSERTFVRQDGYDFEFKTSDGSSRKEEASLITVGDHQGIGVKGSYSYTAPDGQQYEVTYTADDKGYKPQIRVLPAKQ